MKHILEKHVHTGVYLNEAGEEVLCKTIEERDFPALISDLEAEWCKAMEWCEEYKVHNWGTWPVDTAELLKIYQEQRNLEGKPL